MVDQIDIDTDREGAKTVSVPGDLVDRGRVESYLEERLDRLVFIDSGANVGDLSSIQSDLEEAVSEPEEFRFLFWSSLFRFQFEFGIYTAELNTLSPEGTLSALFELVDLSEDQRDRLLCEVL